MYPAAKDNGTRGPGRRSRHWRAPVKQPGIPAPEWRGDDELQLPRTPTEELLAEIWLDILGTDRVSTSDDFFELGGHSLLATRVISRIARDLDVDISLRTVFEAPTVAELAPRIDAARLFLERPEGWSVGLAERAAEQAAADGAAAASAAARSKPALYECSRRLPEIPTISTMTPSFR